MTHRGREIVNNVCGCSRYFNFERSIIDALCRLLDDVILCDVDGKSHTLIGLSETSIPYMIKSGTIFSILKVYVNFYATWKTVRNKKEFDT